MLLLCSVVMVISLSGFFLKDYVPQITEKVLDAVLRAAVELGR